MPEDAYVQMVQQHNALLQQLIVTQNQVNFLWVAFTVFVFVQVVGVVVLPFAAVWSVNTVLKSNVERTDAMQTAMDERMKQLETQWMDHKVEIRRSLEIIVATLRGQQSAGDKPA